MNKKINRQILLAGRPVGLPKESDFKLVESSIPSPKDGEVLIEVNYLSVDPYMRGRMNETKSYAPSFQLNEVITGGGVGRVIESKSQIIKNGDFVTGMFGWQEYLTVNEKDVRILNPELAPVSTALGVLGMPGLTAYFGLLDIGQPQKGETVVVSGAAGAVGTIVGQITKIKGCNVVGITGSDEKVKYLIDELGFQNAINYKNSPDMKKELRQSCPKGVDVYFDNVGGEISDAVISQISDNARIPICGQISIYNATSVSMGPRIQGSLLVHTATMKGFLVFHYTARYEEGISQLAKWLMEGKIKYHESIVEGFENTPKAFIGLFTGENLGKQLVKLK